MATEQRDWRSLEAKIGNGLTFEEAYTQAGIPEDEAKAYLISRISKKEAISGELKMLAEQAIKVGLKGLIKIAEEGPRVATRESDGAGGGTSYTPISSDLDAAQALTKFGIDAIKLINQFQPIEAKQPPKVNPGTAGGLMDDLWDLRKPG